MNVPTDIEVPEDADADFRRRIDAVNRYLGWAREQGAQARDEAERRGKVRTDGMFYNGPGGAVL